MFHYTFPCGGFKTHTTMTETGIVFDPPVYEQRYCAVIQILEDLRWIKEIKKVTEFGCVLTVMLVFFSIINHFNFHSCAEMRLFQLIRRIETIEHIIQVRKTMLLLPKYTISFILDKNRQVFFSFFLNNC